MDYDQTTIANDYDAARGHTPAVMQQWLDLVAAHVPFAPKLIVDVGCGTGRFSKPLADRFAAKVIGIDPSQSMLAAARAKPVNARVEFRLAPAERLPWPTAAQTWCSCLWCSTTCRIRKPRRANAAASCVPASAFACAPALVTSSIRNPGSFPACCLWSRRIYHRLPTSSSCSRPSGSSAARI